MKTALVSGGLALLAALVVLVSLLNREPAGAGRAAPGSAPAGLEQAAGEDAAGAVPPLERSAPARRALPASGPVAAEASRDEFIVSVVGADGAALPGARIVSLATGAGWTTDAEGRAVLDAASGAGRDCFLVMARGHLAARIEQLPASRRVRLERDPGLEVLVRAAGGDPVADAELRCRWRAKPLQDPLPGAAAAVLEGFPEPPAHTDAGGRGRVFGALFEQEFQILEVTVDGRLRQVRDLRWEERDPGTNWPEPVIVTLDERIPTVTLVDASGAPLAGVPVQVAWRGAEYPHQTGPRGSFPLPYVPVGDHPDRIAASLDGGTTWLATAPSEEPGERILYRVEPRTIRGRLRASDPREYEVATALAARDSFGAVAAVPGDFVPQPFSPLAWTGIPAGGAFTIAGGYQGPHTAVLVRHRASGVIPAWAVLAPGEAEVELTVPDLCAVRLDGAAAMRRPGLSFRLLPVQAAAADADPARLGFTGEDLPLVLSVPQGRYQVFFGTPPSLLPLASVDAAGPEAEVFLGEAVSWAAVAGRVRDSFSRPLAGAVIVASAPDGAFLARTTTDAAGAFGLEIPQLEGRGTRLDLWWPLDGRQPWLSALPRKTVWVNGEAAGLDLELEAGLLALTRDPAGLVGGELPVWLTELDEESGRAKDRWPVFFPEGAGEARLRLPPGEFSIAVDGEGPARVTRRVRVAAGLAYAESLSLGDAGIIALHLVNETGGRVEVRLRFEAAGGSAAAFDAVYPVESELHRTLLAPAAEYAVSFSAGRPEAGARGPASSGATVLRCSAGHRSVLPVRIAPDGRVALPESVTPAGEEF